MTPEEFSYLAGLLKEQTGLALLEDKSYILESRLMTVVRAFNLCNVSDLILLLKQGDVAVTEAFVEALSANGTLFFRDVHPFVNLREMAFPFLFKNKTDKVIRILSAGCSSGQEPYSIAMVVKEFQDKNPDWKFEIVAVDISGAMLAKAISGTYTQFDVQRGLPIRKLLEHFTKQEGFWQINDDIKQMVDFKKVNLLDDISHLGVFDIVFCRYLIHRFDLSLKPVILDKIADIMNPEGLLFLGDDETVLGITNSFKTIKDVPSIFTVDKAAKNN